MKTKISPTKTEVIESERSVIALLVGENPESFCLNEERRIRLKVKFCVEECHSKDFSPVSLKVQ